MEARIEPNWATLGHDIWFFQRSVEHGRPVVYYPGAPGDLRAWQLDEADAYAEVEPSLRLAPGMLEALLAAAEKVIPASHATERHLQREISVSERLLALVERGWEA